MKPFSDLFPHILPFAPAAPDPLVEQYARLAAIEFCQRSRCWRDVQEITVTGLESEIISAPAGADIFEIESGYFKLAATDDRWKELDPIAYGQINPDLLDLEAADSAYPEFLSQSSVNSVALAPRAAGILRISAFLTPSQAATTAPDFLFERYPTIIAAGALMHLLMIPQQPYTDFNLGALKAGIFNAACDHHFNFNIRGQQRAPARTKPLFM